MFKCLWAPGVTQTTLEEARRDDLQGAGAPDKTFNRRRDNSTKFYESEFHRRNLLKRMDGK